MNKIKMVRPKTSDIRHTIDGKALIHIPFFYKEDRLKYLIRVLESLKGYRFSLIHIVIDTNSRETEKRLGMPLTFERGMIECVVHDDLKHPYYLTWQHREPMKRNAGDYDYFIYTEDDILVSWEAIIKWREDVLLLGASGYNRGFIRAERDRRGRTVCFFPFKLAGSSAVKIGDKAFIHPSSVHTGFWICDQAQIKDFISRYWYDTPKQMYSFFREQTTYGWLYDKKEKSLIPLNGELKIPEEALAYHLPDNYALNPLWGRKLAVEKAVCGRAECVIDRVFFASIEFLRLVFRRLFRWSGAAYSALRDIYAKLKGY